MTPLRRLLRQAVSPAKLSTMVKVAMSLTMHCPYSEEKQWRVLPLPSLQKC